MTPETRTGDFAPPAPGAEPAEDPLPPPGPAPSGAGPALWHSAVVPDTGEAEAGADPTQVAPSTSGTGTVTTGWYPVPEALPGEAVPATHVVVPVAGNEPERQRIVVEFGYGPPTAPTSTVATVLDPAPGLTARQWQEIPTALPGDRPSAVRVVAQDQVAGPDSALALAPPHLAAVQPVQVLTGPDEPGSTTTGAGDVDTDPRPDVFADQLSAALWPCVNQVAVAHGIAPTPDLRLVAAENTPDFILTNPTYESWGGTLVQTERTWATVRVFSGVTPGGPPTLQWGNVDRIVYDHPTDGYDLTVGQETRGGLTSFPTLAGQPYTGREYLG